MIVIQSFLARFGFIHLMKLVHFTSVSRRMAIVIVSVFSIFYVNYGLLYLIAPFRIDIAYLNSIMIGIYRDFNSFWFSDIGTMVIIV